MSPSGKGKTHCPTKSGGNNTFVVFVVENVQRKRPEPRWNSGFQSFGSIDGIGDHRKSFFCLQAADKHQEGWSICINRRAGDKVVDLAADRAVVPMQRRAGRDNAVEHPRSSQERAKSRQSTKRVAENRSSLTVHGKPVRYQREYFVADHTQKCVHSTVLGPEVKVGRLPSARAATESSDLGTGGAPALEGLPPDIRWPPRAPPRSIFRTAIACAPFRWPNQKANHHRERRTRDSRRQEHR